MIQIQNEKRKSIAVVALDPMAGASYKQEIENLFGEYAEVRGYSVRDGSATGKLPCADLFVISTDAYGSAEEVARHVPIDSEVMSVEVTFHLETLEKLWKLPKDKNVLFVNLTEVMAREAIAQLNALGVNHLHFIPYRQGMPLTEDVDIIVTPAEGRYVPQTDKPVIDIGQRPCSYSMMIEIALRLGLEHLLETESFLDYEKSVVSKHYSFDKMFSIARRQESQFHILMEILNEGLVGVNESGEIFACNKKACQIARVSEKLVIGKRGEDVFPYISFYKALKEKIEIPEKITKLYSNNISIAVIPVLRKGECIGAFATLQYFNEQEQRQNELRSQLLKKGHYAKYSFDDVIGDSPVICRTKEMLKRMAATESPILIVGETGTGKELMAHSVHRASARAEGPFIAINVAAMPENLLESELFGYADGAFTGARKGGKPGLFEFAHQGTLFLDEVEGMSASMQVKLLRVLQEREVMRVGGSNIVKVDVRVVAATNEFLEEKVETGSFRRDLYYRLNALTVVLPPLRERDEDIFMLLDHFRNEIGGNFELAEETKRFLLAYSWPGNIRELHNAAEYFNYIGKPVIEVQDLPPTMTKKLSRHTFTDDLVILTHTKQGSLQEFIMEQIFLAEQNGGSIGREALLQAAKQKGFHVSQKKIRDLLSKMTEDGLIIRGRGRGGNRLTPRGLKQYSS
ncbi:sigma-54 interaction domain-containing protein [Mediterraneibacter agrestimuris]|uniref:sigma-54 interaction domain-containing protein n=1 Tax=Mediterraneibacter agrestimuris TaxID=2941333 RepID=UPI00203EC472|nr:sigma 54-interacting transcriptional regulator [Mediterraneibacter agrestimuris]